MNNLIKISLILLAVFGANNVMAQGYYGPRGGNVYHPAMQPRPAMQARGWINPQQYARGMEARQFYQARRMEARGRVLPGPGTVHWINLGQPQHPVIINRQQVVVVPVQPQQEWTTPAERACEVNRHKAESLAYSQVNGWQAREFDEMTYVINNQTVIVRLQRAFYGPSYLWLSTLGCYVEIPDQQEYARIHWGFLSHDLRLLAEASELIQTHAVAEGLVPEQAEGLE